MFGKLMNYELRYNIRLFAPMWAVVLALCTTFRLSLGNNHITAEDGFFYLEGNEAVLPAVIGVITVFAIITMSIVAMVVLIQRFYKGMYGDEGYLMFTLPVTTGQLIHSKALVALLMTIVTMVVTMLGVLIMMSFPQLWSGDLGMSIPMVWDAFVEIMAENGISVGMLAVYIFWGLLAGLLTTAVGFYMIYLAISLGQLWKKHPVAGGIIAYYVINLAVNGIEMAVGLNMEFLFMNNVVYESQLITLLLYMTVHSLVLLGISFFGTKLMLDKKLNIA